MCRDSSTVFFSARADGIHRFDGIRQDGSGDMAAYLIVKHIITDAEKLEEYRLRSGR